MSADYSTCQSCNLGYREDSDYACFCDCGCNFCSQECGKLDNYEMLDEIDEDDSRYQDYLDGEAHIDKSKPITCVICRYEQYTDYTLLEAVLAHFRITREIAINIWRLQKQKNKE